MNRPKKFWKLTIVLFIVVITSAIIGIKKYIPESKAEEKNTKTIQVTYKAGIGTGEEVTVEQPLCDSQTKGENDYTDGKIVLYRNGKNGLNFSAEQVEYNGTMYDRILTGWKLTSVMKNGTEITNFVEPENQNYADRTNANKDIGTVYAQDGWYIVPDGVTAITVEAVYARAIYIRSPFDTMYYDEFHIFYYGENSDGTTTLDGTAVAKSSDDNDGSTAEKAVSTLKRAYELITASSDLTVYDTAFVLCGDMYEINYNPAGNKYATEKAGTYKNYSSNYFGYNSISTKPVTIVSSEEKKYNFYAVSPTWDFYNYSSLRLDNINFSTLPKSNLEKRYAELSATIDTYTMARQFRTQETMTFETTETMISNDLVAMFWGKVKFMKLNGGKWSLTFNYGTITTEMSKPNCVMIGGLSIYDIISTSGRSNGDNKEYYVTNPTILVITGGRISDGIYGTGYSHGGNVKGNVYIFVTGGYISNLYGGGNSSVASNAEQKGDINIEITGGLFENIFGAGKHYTSKVSGDIHMSIKNATIRGNIYGGGKGGQVQGEIFVKISDTIVKGSCFGGGLGATDAITYRITESYAGLNQGYENAKTQYNKYAVNLNTVKWEEAPNNFPTYNENTSEVIGRKWHQHDINGGTSYYFLENGLKYSLTLANVEKNVNMEIENSTVEKNIYGGGSIGLIEGNINLNVKNTTVNGNIYGGGDGITTPSAIALYAPIQDYKELTSYGWDSNQKIGDFSWTNDKEILTYFKGIYDGKNKVIYNSDNTTTAFSELSAEAQAVVNKYGTKQLVYSSDVDKLGQVDGDITINIDGGTYKADIYGGGNAGITKGNTNVTIGQENSNTSINVTGLVYGGGRGYDANNDGDASDFTTVYGNSKVLIQGVNTSVENYGSTKLGAVAGNVDVNFKNYWSGNSTAKYQKMNGIDRATTVSFENSYVLLENKDLSGNLVGIQSIENLKIPSGSGLKISANGEITGNFEGGGELYLDSLVCLTVGGNITGQTTMVLNPELMESGTQLIRGGIKAPYLKVKGTATEDALSSGEPNKYKIIQASKEAVKETTGEDYIYYYIAEDIIIENDITVSSNSIAGRSYKNPITNTEDQYILNSGIFSTDVGVDYYLTNSAYKSKDYTNITRKLKLISNSNNGKTVEFPIGTEVLMIVNNEYYYYIVDESTASEISLADFKKSDETVAKYNELKDITNSDLVTKTYNEIKGTTSYAFKENYKFIFSFENTNGIEEDTYYPSIEAYYGGSSFGDAKKDVANNIVNLQKREYSAELSKDREYYESNGIINLSGNITVSEVNAKTVLPTNGLNLRLKLQNSNGKEIAIPQGTQIKLNEQEGLIQDGQAIIKWPDNIGTSGRTENINMTIDMTGVLPQNRLQKDNYTIKLEYQDNKMYKELTEIQANIINEQTEYGVSAKVNQMEGIAEDKIQLIEQGQEIRRSIKVSSTNSSELKNMKIKIKAEEKTGEFEYQETTNSKKISIDTQEISMVEQKLEQDVNVTFRENIQSGIYKIVVELYDEYGELRTQDYVSFVTIK